MSVCHFSPSETSLRRRGDLWPPAEYAAMGPAQPLRHPACVRRRATPPLAKGGITHRHSVSAVGALHEAPAEYAATRCPRSDQGIAPYASRFPAPVGATFGRRPNTRRRVVRSGDRSLRVPLPRARRGDLWPPDKYAATRCLRSDQGIAPYASCFPAPVGATFGRRPNTRRRVVRGAIRGSLPTRLDRPPPGDGAGSVFPRLQNGESCAILA